MPIERTAGGLRFISALPPGGSRYKHLVATSAQSVPGEAPPSPFARAIRSSDGTTGIGSSPEAQSSGKHNNSILTFLQHVHGRPASINSRIRCGVV